MSITLHEALLKHLRASDLSLLAEELRDVDILIMLSKHENAIVREGAIYGLSHLITEIVTRLIELQEDQFDGVRKAAIEAMERDWR